MIVLIGSK